MRQIKRSDAMATDEVRKGESHATNDRTEIRAGPQRSRTAQRRRPESRLWAVGRPY
jgi:hypothetical protein